jgi:hypothetical protein
MHTENLPIMDKLTQVTELSAKWAKHSIPKRSSYLKYGYMTNCTSMFIMFQFRNHKRKHILQFFSSELRSPPTASSQSLSLSHSHDLMMHWPVAHWNWCSEHCCGAKVATQHRK